MEHRWKGDVEMKVGMLECNQCGNEEKPEQVAQRPLCTECHSLDWNIVVTKLEEQKFVAI